MTQENVEIVRAAINAWNRGDWDGVGKDAAGDFELVPPSQSPLSEPLRGMDEVRAWAADQQETVGDLSIEIEELIESGESIVALIRLVIRPQACGCRGRAPDRTSAGLASGA